VYQILPGRPPAKWLDLRIPNGHKVLANGSHVIAAEGTIMHVAADGRMLDSISADVNGTPFRRPNDIALDGHGGFYVTDPGLGESENRQGRLFYVNAAWVVTPVADGFCYPNGIVLRADGKPSIWMTAATAGCIEFPFTAEAGSEAPSDCLLSRFSRR